MYPTLRPGQPFPEPRMYVPLNILQQLVCHTIQIPVVIKRLQENTVVCKKHKRRRVMRFQVLMELLRKWIGP